MIKTSQLEPRLLIGLMFVPFALQLLGWSGTPLGGGPCGAISTNQLLLEQPQVFFYAQLMLVGICLLMTTGFLLLMLSFMQGGQLSLRQARLLVGFAGWVALLTALLYLLTRTTGLPAPSSIGWLAGAAEPVDGVGILVGLALLAQSGLALHWWNPAWFLRG